MSTVVAIVKSIVGQVIATSAEGAQRVLVEGDRLYVGDTLDTGAGGMVTLELADGRMLDLGRDTQWSSADAASAAPTQSVAEAQTEVIDVQRAIAAGADPTQDLAPTAAGPGAAGGGGTAGGSRSFVLLEETAGQVQPEIGISFTDPTGGDAVVQEQTFGDNLNLPPSFTSADGNNSISTINVTTNEDIAYSGNFTAVDANGDALTYSLVGTGVSHGSLTLTPQGAWTYTPAADYNGPDSFQVVVSDGRGGTDSLTVNIGVTPVNDAPVADPATGSATEDGAVVSGQLTASDVDSGDTQTFSLQAGTTAPAGFTLNSNGTWSIDPSNAAYQSLGAGQQLTIDVPFTVTDSGGLTGNSVLTLTITGVNDAAVLSSATETVVETDSAITTGGTLTISDIDSPATFVAQTNSAGTYGTFSIDAAGVWTFTANSAYNELNVGQSLSDSFDVFAADGTKTTVTVTINGSNDAPVASSTVVASGSEDPAAPIAVTLGGSDVDGSVVSYTVQSLPANGTLFADAAGTVPVTVGVPVSGPVYFVPNADWNGTTTFDYTATDNSGASSAPATATINVSAVPDAPTVVISTDANNDGTVTNVELGGSPTLTVTVGLPADAVAGNTVTVIGSTGTPQVIVLTPAIINAGVITTTFPVPADGSTFTATATVTDNNGLTSPSASDNAVIGDTTATAAPTVVISTDTNNDGTLSNTELGASTSVSVKITLPSDAVVGDTLNITNPDGSTQTHTIVAADLNDGVDLTFPRPVDGAGITVTATITDAAGNTSQPGSDTATVGDTTATAAPTVVISTDANNDGTLSNVELGTSTTVTVKITVPAGTLVGDTLNITNPNGSVTPHTVTAADLNDGVTLTYPRPADGVGISVSATVTDAAGNTSVPGSDSATVGNTTAPGAPTVVITTDANNNGILSNTELGNSTSIYTHLQAPASAKPGDILTLSVNGVTIGSLPVTQGLITNGATLVTPRGADGSTFTVTATITDADGNVSAPGSDSAVIGDTTATAAPTVVISTDSDNNGVLSAAELGNSATVTVKITVPNGTLVGDTLNITNPDGSVTAHTIEAADLSNGVELTYPRPADGVGLTVSATITDAAGNKSQPGSDSATVGDTTATPAPTVAISTDSNNDGTLSSSELGASTTVTVKITVPVGTVVGDTLNITNPDGSVSTHTVLAADLTDGVTLTYPRPADGAAINVSATITDAAGNTSAPGSDSATVGDTTATAAPTVVISTDANNDGTLSAIELSATTVVTVKITVPTGTVVGDTLKITNPDGSVSTHTVVAGELTDGLELTYPRPADGTAINVSATITDAAGNTSAPGSDSATVGDTTATAAPTVVISTDTNNDGTLSNTELGASTTVSVKITVPTGTVVGDTLNITNPDGSVSTHTVLAADLTDGVTLTYPRPADGQPISVSATITDAAGNTSAPGSDSATVGDTTATAAPTVIISTDTDNDGTLSNTELGASTTVTVKITVPTGTVVGDTLNITNPDGSVTPHTVLAADLTDGVTLTYPRPADGTAINVSATITDAAGNTSAPGSDSATVGDTTATAAPTVVISTDTNNDGTLSNTELGASTTVSVKITVPTGTVVGDTLNITNPDGSVTAHSVVAADLTNGLTLTYPRPADGQPISVSATITDIAGNTSAPGSDSATVGDTTAASAPVVTIVDDANNNAQLTAAEVGSDGVQVTVAVNNADLVAGGTVSLSIDNGGVIQSANLALSNGVLVNAGTNTPATGFTYSNGTISFTEAKPATGASISVTATQSDAAGNVSPQGSDSAQVVNTNPDAIDDLAGSAYTVSLGDKAGALTSNNWGALDSKGLGITVGAVKADGSAGTLYSGSDDGNSNTLGVANTPRASADVANQLEYDPATGKSEAIVVSFNGNLNHAEFNVSHLVANEAGGEVGRWVAMYNGSVVASGEFKLSSGGAGGFTIDTGSLVFDSIRFEGVNTVNGTGDGSDYFLTGLSGSGPASANSAYTVSENGTLTIADGSKDLTANDTDADNDALLVTQVNGQAITNGAVTLASGALVTANANGSFSYNTNGKFDALKAGEVATDTFTYTISDGHGGTDTATATVTIIGTNDAPTVSGTSTGAVVEAGNLDDGSVVSGQATATGTLTATDVDNGSSTTWSLANGTGTYGTLAITAGGAWTYTLNNSAAATQALAEGQTGKETFTATVTDNNGATVTQTITIDVTGTNDAPTVSAPLLASGTEDGANVVVNLLTGASDVDTGAVLSIANVSALPAGVTLNGSTLTVNPADASFQSLAAGASKDIVVTYNVVDDKGAVVAQTATITITGTNDAPTVSGAVVATAAEDSASFNVNLLTNASDVDSGAVLSVNDVSALPAGVTLTGNTLTVNPADASFQSLNVGESQIITVTYNVVDQFGASTVQTATITITGTNDAPTVSSAIVATAAEDSASFNVDLLAGASDVDHGAVLNVTDVGTLPAGVTRTGNTLTVNPADASFQSLNVGESKVLTITYNVIDDNGAKVAQTATITITGTNDAPTVSGAVVATAAEDSASFNVNLLTNASDVDHGAVLNVTDVGTLPAGVTRTGNTLTVNPADASFQSLAVGESKVLTVTYNVVDDNGAKVAQTATITITGTNDLPVVTSNAAAATGTVVEAGNTDDGAVTNGAATATGTLTASDVDHNASTSWSLNSTSGTYGNIAITAGGVWTYTLNNSAAATQGLAEGQTRTETFTATVTDNNGGTATQVITVNVTGTNDVPTVAAALTATAAEDSASFNVNLLAGASDVDSGAVLSVANVSTLPAGVTRTGSTLTVNPADASFQSLNVGESKVITVTYNVVDDKGAVVAQTATITITGSNDAPTVSGAVVATAAEDSASFNVNMLSGASDVDHGAVLNVTDVGTLPAGVTRTGNTLTVNPADASFQSLNVGESKVLTITYNVIDDNGAKVAQTATITITGTNDAPTVSGAVVATAAEDSASFNVNMLSNASDADHGAVLNVTDVGTLPAGVTRTGNTLTVNPADASFQSLAVGESKVLTVTYNVVDDNGAKVAQTATITITGTNDAPVVTSTAAAATGTVIEAGNTDAGVVTNGTQTATGTLTASDVDHNASTTWSLSNTTGTYGTLAITPGGAWTYTLNNSNAATQALAEGQTGKETFTAIVTDNNGATATQTITVNVTGTNDAPAGTNATIAMTEDVGRAFTASDFGFTDVDSGDSFKAVRIDTLPASGTLTLNNVAITAGTVVSAANFANLVYTPAANANGNALATLTFSVQDSKDGFDPSPNTLTFNVAAVNDAPVAVADHYSLGLTGQYFGYAQGSGANLETISQVESLIAGKTPNATFIATSLNYGSGTSAVTSDLGAGTNLQTFLGSDKASLSTDPVTTTDAIIKLSGQVSLAAGTYTFRVTSDDGFILRIDGQDVIKFDGNRSASATTGNYTIPTSGAHQIEIIYWDQGGNAVLKVETKVAGAADSTYTVLGASGNTSSLVTAEDTALTIKASTLLGNDSDVDGDTLTIASVQNPTHGTVALANGVITFTPDANYNGEATFQYTISDGKGGTASATVTLNVTPVNDAPTAANQSVTTNEDVALQGTIAGADVDNDALTYSIATGPAHGSLTLNATTGAYTYTPATNYNGSDSFVVKVADPSGAFVNSTVTVGVTPVADIVADTGVTNEDTAVTLNVLANDSFGSTNGVSNGTITAINGQSIANNGSVTVDHGTVKLVAGQLVFTPAANYHGQSNFTYTVTAGGVTETAGVKLMINSVSDAAAPTVSVTPKGYWTFDSAAGGTVTNASKTTETGTLADDNSTGGSAIPTLSSTSRADGAGKYLQLNSGNDIGDHIDVSTAITDALMGTATLTFWLNTTQFGNGSTTSWNNPSIIGSEQVSGGNDIQWGAITDAGTIGFGLGNVNGVYSTTVVNDGLWHNIAISRDATTNLVNVYVDGKLEATGSPTDPAFTGTLNKLLEIGATNAFNGNGDVADSNYFKGALDDLRIYNGVLTADQIAAIKHVESGYENTAIANAHTAAQNTLAFSVADTASVLKVSGLEAGMTISDNNGHTATSTGVDSLIDLSDWSVANLTLGNTGTSSATLIFAGSNSVNVSVTDSTGTSTSVDTSTTYQALTLANGTSVLATTTDTNHSLTGSSAADLLRGNSGNDILDGGAGNDRLEGGAGNDTLYGGAGNDILIGGDGNDLLYGGSGNNILTGGAGADTFTWQAGDVGKSTITDFNAVEGDRINLNDLLPDVTDANILSYLKVDTSTSTIQISTSGHIDQGSDVSITLQGVDLTTYGSSSADIIKSLVAGTDPVVKTDHH